MVFLLTGGILVLGVVLTRWPAVHWLAADTFHMVLTAHGLDMPIFRIIFFLIFDPVALSHRNAALRPNYPRRAHVLNVNRL